MDKRIEVHLDVQPFKVPNYVLEWAKPPNQSFAEGRKFYLSELSDAALHALCNKFRDDVLARAEKGRANND